MRAPKTAVILSGGEGLRLRPITHDIPKGLVKVGGKPLLEWVVEWLQQNRVTDLVIGVAYLKEKIMRHFGSGGKFGVDIRYSVHTVEGGTSEGFRLAISRYVDSPSFFALNGDQITNLRLATIYNNYRENVCLASIAVVHPRLPFGLVEINKKGFCKGFVEKPVLNDVFISMGIYVFDRKRTKQNQRSNIPSASHRRRSRNLPLHPLGSGRLRARDNLSSGSSDPCQAVF